MKEYCQLLLYLMKVDLRKIQNEHAGPIPYILHYYEITDRYWTILSERLALFQFRCNKEEIHFFKEIKPLFTSEIEFVSLVYQLEAFTPISDLEFCSFIKKERSRLSRFRERNQAFYQYYKEERTELDDIFFLRSNNLLNYFVYTRPYDLPISCCTSHDYLVSTILALEKYETYLNKRYPDHHCN
jgi:hypothetical protein